MNVIILACVSEYQIVNSIICSNCQLTCPKSTYFLDKLKLDDVVNKNLLAGLTVLSLLLMVLYFIHFLKIMKKFKDIYYDKESSAPYTLMADVPEYLKLDNVKELLLKNFPNIIKSGIYRVIRGYNFAELDLVSRELEDLKVK